MKIFVALVILLFVSIGLACAWAGIMIMNTDGIGYIGLVFAANFLFFAWKGWKYLQELRAEDRQQTGE